MTEIEPINKEEKYILEDKDFLLIEALRDLTTAINRLNEVKL